jgi:hypothetical protein
MGLGGVPELFGWIMIPCTYVIVVWNMFETQHRMCVVGDERIRKPVRHDNIEQKNTAIGNHLIAKVERRGSLSNRPFVT